MTSLPPKPRGVALLTVLVVLLAVSILGATIVVAAGRHLSVARHAETSVGLSNCAMAVRQYIASQVAAGAFSQLSFTVPGTNASITLQGGHYEGIDINNFTLSAGPSFGVTGGSGVQNLANSLPMTVGASSTQRIGTAVCTDANKRVYEVEFSYVGP